MNEQIDVVIVGGGPAGMTAALYLGRARKRVVVLDEQKPRHAVSAGVHNFLTRDGMDPGQLRQVAWAQMERYDSVRLVAGRAHSMAREGDAWQIESSAGRRLTSRAVLLAPGIIDEHPRIPGYDERWGASIHHCPYCHGWEMRELPLAVLAHGDAAMHMAPLLQGWSDDVILISHGQTITDEERATLEGRGIAVYTERIAALEGEGSSLETIVLADGTRLARRGLFVRGKQRPVALIEQLGVEVRDGFVVVDEQQRTSLPNLWAAGDCTTYYQQVLEAAAQGGRAAALINAALTIGA